MKKFKSIVISIIIVLMVSSLLAACADGTFTITFDGSGGTLVSGETVQTVMGGNEIIPPVFEKTGYLLSWNYSEFDMVTSDLTIAAVWTPISYVIRYDGNGAEGGETPDSLHTYDEPKSLSGNGFIRSGYTFQGWAATEDGEVLYGDREQITNLTAQNESTVTLYAIWSAERFTYTFYDEDGTTVLKTETVDYGSPITAPKDPEKQPTAEYTYTFAGWDKEIPSKITGNITFKARYDQTKNKYTYVFYNDDRVLKEETAEYGSAIVPPPDPAKEQDERYVYTFAGWDKEVPETIEGNIEFYAVYTTTARQYTYTFYDDDGETVLKTETVDYGSPIIAPEDPQKPPTAQYTFTFANWDREIPASITQDLVFVACYHSEIRKYTIAYETNGGSYVPPVTLDYNSFVVPYDTYKEGYSLSAWYRDPGFENAWNFITDVVTEDVTLYAEWYQDGLNFTYLDSGEYEVSYSGSVTGNVTIPNTLFARAIVGITAHAFENAAITGITIPKSVTYIGDYAFSGCTSLIGIALPENVIELGRYVFSGCSSLEYIVLPSNLTQISEGLFKECVKIESIALSGITHIRDYAFYGCEKLKDIMLPQGLEGIGRYSFSGCLKFESISVPGSVTKIDEGAFANIVNLKEVDLKEGIKIIGGNAFFGCSGISGINIPGSVESIGASAFEGTGMIYAIIYAAVPPAIEEDSLPDVSSGIKIYVPEGCVEIYRAAPVWENYYSQIHSKDIISGDFAIDGGLLLQYLGNESIVSIPSGVTAIGSKVFMGRTLLKEIIIPDTVTIIGSAAFYDCAALESITVPDSVRQIGHFAFKGCTGLTELTIPESVAAIGERAFEGCVNLTALTLNGGEDSIGEAVFINCTALKTVIIGEELKSISAYAFYGCTGLESVTIPAGVTSIGEYAFYGCSSLAAVTISEGVESIEEGAFTGCEMLQSVTLLAVTPPACDRFAFAGLALTARIFVPAESVETYKASDIWSSYSGQIYAIPDET